MIKLQNSKINSETWLIKSNFVKTIYSASSRNTISTNGDPNDCDLAEKENFEHNILNEKQSLGWGKDQSIM